MNCNSVKIMLLAVCIVYSPVRSQDINLPAPVLTGGKSLMDALDLRRTIRSYTNSELENQTLSNLLWAAGGINTTGNRTAAAPYDHPEIKIYTAIPSGLYLYHPDAHRLKLLSASDIRFNKAAYVNLLYVADLPGDDSEMILKAAANTAFISQNVYLFCASEGLGSCVQSSFNKSKLTGLLGLGNDQEMILVQTIGRTDPEQYDARPQKQYSMPLMEVFDRHTAGGKFGDKIIPEQTLSDLLWSAFGINRPESGRRTAPSAWDLRNIDIYVLQSTGIYLFNAVGNQMQFISDEDIRPAGEHISDAVLFLLYIADNSSSRSNINFISYAHTGFISENASLFCTASGLITQYDTEFSREEIRSALGIPDDHEIIFMQSVGYPAENCQIQDSLALVALYNQTNGTGWKNHEHWLNSPVIRWEGVTLIDGYVTEINLPDNNLSGDISAEIRNCTKLTSINLEHNHISGLPDLQMAASLNTMTINNNLLTFEDIEPNIEIPDFIYSPQDSIGSALDTTINEDASFQLTVTVGGSANYYQWLKNETPIDGAVDNTLTFSTIKPGDSGTYHCRISNSIATELIIYSRQSRITVIPEMNTKSDTRGTLTQFSVTNNYPNPFNQETTLYYELPKSCMVCVEIYNNAGEKLETLLKKEMMPGRHIIRWSAENHPTGIYFCRILFHNHSNQVIFSKINKLLMIK